MKLCLECKMHTRFRGLKKIYDFSFIIFMVLTVGNDNILTILG